MDGKVILEEHFATPATLGDSQVFGGDVWAELGPRLTDIQDKRLRFMDRVRGRADGLVAQCARRSGDP